jgi:phosphoglycerate dehydrogenase-like enzyme
MRESLLSMMLHFNRQIGKSLADQKKKIWGRFDYNEVSLFNQRVLIVGYGSLGQSMAETAGKLSGYELLRSSAK